MYDTGYNSIINQIPRTFYCGLAFTSDYEILDDVDVVEFEYENGCTSEEVFGLGATVSASIKIKMLDNDYDFSQEFMVYLGIEVDDGNGYSHVDYGAYPMGHFVGDKEVEYSDDFKTITAYDAFTYKCERVYISDLMYPTPYLSVLNELYSKAGLGIFESANYCEAIASELNLDVQMPVKKDGYTYRDMFGYIAAMFGGFAWVRRDGRVNFKDFNATSSLTILKDAIFKVNKKTADTGIIIDKCIIYRREGVKYEYSYEGLISPTLSRKTLYNTNPLMHQTVFDGMKESVTNISFHPYEATFMGLPQIDVGDRVTLQLIDDTYISSVVMRIIHKFDGGLTTTIFSYPISYDEDSYDASSTVLQQIKNENIIKSKNYSDSEGVLIDLDSGEIHGQSLFLSKKLSAKKCLQSGSILITATANAVSSANVSFDNEMADIPAVILTASSGAPYTAVRGVTASNVTKNGFTVNLYRTNAVDTTVYWFAHCNT